MKHLIHHVVSGGGALEHDEGAGCAWRPLGGSGPPQGHICSPKHSFRLEALTGGWPRNSKGRAGQVLQVRVKGHCMHNHFCLAKDMEEGIWSSQDRADKCSNKLEIIERRLEALQNEYKDFSRQIFCCKLLC